MAGTDVAGSVPHSPVDNTTWASASISDQVSTEGRILGLGQSVVSDPEQVKDLNDTTEETPIVSPVRCGQLNFRDWLSAVTCCLWSGVFKLDGCV